MYFQIHLERLRLELLEKSGMQSPFAQGCARLSIAIFLASSDDVSILTLNYIFGITAEKLNVPLAVMDMLARYAGYAGWADFTGFDIDA